MMTDELHVFVWPARMVMAYCPLEILPRCQGSTCGLLRERTARVIFNFARRRIVAIVKFYAPPPAGPSSACSAAVIFDRAGDQSSRAKIFRNGGHTHNAAA